MVQFEYVIRIPDLSFHYSDYDIVKDHSNTQHSNPDFSMSSDSRTKPVFRSWYSKRPFKFRTQWLRFWAIAQMCTLCPVLRWLVFRSPLKRDLQNANLRIWIQLVYVHCSGNTHYDTYKSHQFLEMRNKWLLANAEQLYNISTRANSADSSY